MKYIILIPAFTTINEQITNTNNYSLSPIFFNIGSKLIINLIYDIYSRLFYEVKQTRNSSNYSFEIIAIINEKAEIPSYYMENSNIQILKINQSTDLGDTCLQGIKWIEENRPDTDSVIINFADTLIYDNLSREIIENDNFSLIDDVAHSELSNDYTYIFTTKESGKYLGLIDKNINYGNISDINNSGIYVGFLKLNAYKKFKEFLEENNGAKSTVNSFFTAYDKFCREQEIKHLTSSCWYDAGHNSRIEAAVAGVAARYFNEISIDIERGLLTKKSSNIKKFIGEINWYIKLPTSVSYIVPRIFTYSTDPKSSYVQMEYYGYRTLHELLIFDRKNIQTWKTIIDRIFIIISDLSKYRLNEERGEISKAFKIMYVDKTIDRLNYLKDDINFSKFFCNNIYINGRKYQPLTYFKDKIIELTNYFLEKVDIYLAIIHGDLCFSNILIEENKNFIRLIDPRGAFGKYDIYGDINYDLAKLLHSVEGHYDYIIEDMFDLNCKNNNIIYRHRINSTNSAIQKLLLDKMKLLGTDINYVRFIESLLFLSMIPLHKDHLNRQILMLATGIQLLSTVITAIN